MHESRLVESRRVSGAFDVPPPLSPPPLWSDRSRGTLHEAKIGNTPRGSRTIGHTFPPGKPRERNHRCDICIKCTFKSRVNKDIKINNKIARKKHARECDTERDEGLPNLDDWVCHYYMFGTCALYVCVYIYMYEKLINVYYNSRIYTDVY